MDTKCISCESKTEYNKIVCEDCKREIKNPTVTDGVFNTYHMTYYDEKMKKLIRKYKYGNFTVLSKIFASLLMEMIITNNINPLGYKITSVPSNYISYINRGFIPARLIAKEFSKISGLEYIDLFKSLTIKKQASLGHHERSENVYKKIKLTKSVPEYIIIVDDVYTTGASMNECYSLINGQVKNAFGMTVSKAHRD
ncbi:MAG: ComF family protein [Thermotogota bacterium]